MRIINIPDISPADDDFTELNLGENVSWVRLTGLPRNALERRAKGVRWSRYRGAIEAARYATSSDVVVSHLPNMTAATSMALRLFGKDPRHLGFSFNFTALPLSKRLRYMSTAFSNLEKLVVFSKYEIDLYSKHFSLDPSKFTSLLWAQGPPPVAENHKPATPTRYFCAIGGEGRDIDLILKAAGQFHASVKFVIITRPHLVPSSNIPDNVSILTNIPLDITWAIASQSVAVLVPLENVETCCGHITIVSAKLLGIPIITTHSLATEEYIHGRSWIMTCPSKDLSGFLLLLEEALDEEILLHKTALASVPGELSIHSRVGWRDFLKNFIEAPTFQSGTPA